MDLSRRDFVLLGLGGAALWTAGCGESTGLTARPGVDWPEVPQYGQPQASRIVSDGPRPAGGTPGASPLPPETPTHVGAVPVIGRASWAEAAPLGSRIQPMGYVDRLTVHHEGWTPVYFSDAGSTARRLEAIRRSHLERLHAGDIGYHFIIDRAGKVWQGRDARYQGAHVHDYNPHNIGVMVLGNFDLQRPSNAQLGALRPLLVSLMRQYRVPNSRVFTHQELNKTECPGDSLQAHMVGLRRNGIA